MSWASTEPVETNVRDKMIESGRRSRMVERSSLGLKGGKNVEKELADTIVFEKNQKESKDPEFSLALRVLANQVTSTQPVHHCRVACNLPAKYRL